MAAQAGGGSGMTLGGPKEMTLGGSQEMTLGVMGGGQLGRMFAHAAQQMGFFTAVLDPDTASPAGRVSHTHVPTDYLDAQGLSDLVAACDAITTEFENVPARALADLGALRPVHPGADAVETGSRLTLGLSASRQDPNSIWCSPQFRHLSPAVSPAATRARAGSAPWFRSGHPRT